MLEIYFLFYRIPKMMTRLARERNRSALGWSLIAMGAWIGSELLVRFIFGIVQAIGIELWGWPERSSGLNLLAYVLALIAALTSVSVVSRILTGKQRDEALPAPPLPPSFLNSEPKTLD